MLNKNLNFKMKKLNFLDNIHTAHATLHIVHESVNKNQFTEAGSFSYSVIHLNN